MRILKWIGLGVAILLIVGVGAVYATSEYAARRTFATTPTTVRAATGAEAVARGRHLAVMLGCTGCHGPELHGEEWQDDALHGRLWTANLTRAMPNYTDAQLVAAIREGVRHDGRGLWGMPSEGYVEVTDAEMADLLAWLRTQKPSGAPTPKTAFGPLGRLKIFRRQSKTSPAWVAEARANPAFDAGPAFAHGRHLAVTLCSECHGSNLKGQPGFTPDLLMAASYDEAGFSSFMRTGVAADGKEKGLMTEVARGRLAHLGDQEIADLYAYLRKRAEDAP